MLTPCCWPRRRDFTQSDSDLAELARLMRLKAVDRDTHHTWAKHLWALLAAPPIASVGEEQEVAIGLQRDTEIHSEKNLVLTAVSKPQQPVMSCVCAPTVYGGRGCRTWNAATHKRHGGAQRRYVGSDGVGAWWRYTALREVYGLSRLPAESGQRPPQRLQGNVKPLRKLAAQTSKQRRGRPQSRGNERTVDLVSEGGAAASMSAIDGGGL